MILLKFAALTLSILTFIHIFSTSIMVFIQAKYANNLKQIPNYVFQSITVSGFAIILFAFSTAGFIALQFLR